ncbi:Glycylpeptide N-tetradecanoyltransferase 1 [Striga hermonthica]|uniref:Glycylpeptide N-tetradecanoyltransferase n=1 Tax=Striga hermonthica TaxID=68872 RepID=A0A9N7MM93_STRHE|nr:Glycylpeptide N-tetradecanoyltransferase 1 [Striga hermonthica]
MCETLVELRIGAYVVLPAAGDVCLPALKRLYLKGAESLPRLISGCPVLEELSIVNKNTAQNLEICSPTLLRLELNIQPDDHGIDGNKYFWVKLLTPALRFLNMIEYVFDNISTGRLGSLAVANVSLGCESRFKLEFVGKLCNVGSLDLCHGVMEISDSTFSALTGKFHNLTKLTLSADWRFLSFFLANADNLQVLTIRVIGCGNIKEWREPHQVPTCLSSHLKTVAIEPYECTEEWLFISYVLRNAEVLKLMKVIKLPYYPCKDLVFDALKRRILQLQPDVETVSKRFCVGLDRFSQRIFGIEKDVVDYGGASSYIAASQSWHIGVRAKASKKLVSFITGIPARIRARDSVVLMAEVNFLCVHKKLRSKRLAPVMIKEVTRRVHLENIWQAAYTAGIVLPTPIATCQYWHRSLNPKKLIDVGFSRLGARMTMSRTIKLFKLPDQTVTPRFRKMETHDVPAVTRLLRDYLKQFVVAPDFDENDVEHWLLPKEGAVDSFLVESPETHRITDFCSFYTLESSILGSPNHSILNAAYSYYNVATATPLLQLMNDALIVAKKKDFDVFNSFDVMHNESFLKELKFGPGDGKLHYYLYNYRLKHVLKASELGLVLL